MVVHFTMRTNGVNQAFRFVEGIWLHQKCRQIREEKKQKRPILHHTCATYSELPSYISIMIKESHGVCVKHHHCPAQRCTVLFIFKCTFLFDVIPYRTFHAY